MKMILLVLLFGSVAYAGSTYSTKYDNINVDQIIRNERLLKKYVECLMGQPGCSKEGELLKAILPDALHTGCERCTEAQKRGTKKIVHHLIDNRPEIWNELSKIYDSDGSYKKRYLEEAKQYGVHL